MQLENDRGFLSSFCFLFVLSFSFHVVYTLRFCFPFVLLSFFYYSSLSLSFLFHVFPVFLFFRARLRLQLRRNLLLLRYFSIMHALYCTLCS